MKKKKETTTTKNQCVIWYLPSNKKLSDVQKKQKNMTCNQEKNHSVEASSEMTDDRMQKRYICWNHKIRVLKQLSQEHSKYSRSE